MSWIKENVMPLFLISLAAIFIVVLFVIAESPFFFFNEGEIVDIDGSGTYALLDNGVEINIRSCRYADVGEIIEYGYPIPMITPVGICKGVKE